MNVIKINNHFFIITFIILFLSNTKILAQNTDRLYGKWTLQFIESDTGKIDLSKHGKFRLTILKDSLRYNLSVNSCWTVFQIKDSKIIYHTIACTEVCCDDEFISLINYVGNFNLKGNELTIENKVGIYNLVRIKEN